MSNDLKQDPRTTHLLPPARSSQDWYSSPAPTPSVHARPTVEPSRHYTGYTTGNYAPYWRRYIGIFVKDGKSKFAKVITQLSLEDWAQENGYSIAKSGRLYGSINPDKEKTEFCS